MKFLPEKKKVLPENVFFSGRKKKFSRRRKIHFSGRNFEKK